MKKILLIALMMVCFVSPIHAECDKNDSSFTIDLNEQGRFEKIFDDGSSIIIEDVYESTNARAGLTVSGKKITGTTALGRISLSFFIDTKAYMENDDPENPIYYTKITNYYGKAVTVYAGTYTDDKFICYNLKETYNNPAEIALKAIINADYKDIPLKFLQKNVKLKATISNGYLTVKME